MSNLLRITEDGLDGARAIIALGEGALSRLSALLPQLELTLDVQSLVNRLAREVGEGSEEAWERLVRYFLIPLNQVRRHQQLPPGELLKLVDNALQQRKELRADDFGKWKALAGKVRPLFEPDGYFGLLSKALELYITRPGVLLDVHVLTELRPLYDDEAVARRATILSNTLVIEYREGGRSRTVHLTLDFDDLRALSRELERARRKNDLIIRNAADAKDKVLAMGEQGKPRG
jgi:hypothetical protein